MRRHTHAEHVPNRQLRKHPQKVARKCYDRAASSCSGLLNCTVCQGPVLLAPSPARSRLSKWNRRALVRRVWRRRRPPQRSTPHVLTSLAPLVSWVVFSQGIFQRSEVLRPQGAAAEVNPPAGLTASSSHQTRPIHCAELAGANRLTYRCNSSNVVTRSLSLSLFLPPPAPPQHAPDCSSPRKRR